MNRILFLLSICLIFSLTSTAQKADPFKQHLEIEPAVAFNQLTIWDSHVEETDEIRVRYKDAQTLYNKGEYARAHTHFQYLYTTSFQAIQLYEYMGIIELMIERKDMGQASFLALNNSIIDDDVELQTKALWLLAYSVYKQGMEKSAIRALEMVQKLGADNIYSRSAPLIIQEISR